MGHDIFSRRNRRWKKAIARRPKRAHGMGQGKRALAGNKFRQLHVNWFNRIAKEMKQSPRVIEWILSSRSSAFLT